MIQKLDEDDKSFKRPFPIFAEKKNSKIEFNFIEFSNQFFFL